jgi:hypothetical protein
MAGEHASSAGCDAAEDTAEMEYNHLHPDRGYFPNFDNKCMDKIVTLFFWVRFFFYHPSGSGGRHKKEYRVPRNHVMMFEPKHNDCPLSLKNFTNCSNPTVLLDADGYCLQCKDLGKTVRAAGHPERSQQGKQNTSILIKWSQIYNLISLVLFLSLSLFWVGRGPVVQDILL